jgi:aspartate carbamoyltransferase catalytic subunit
MNHLLSAEQFTANNLNDLFEAADRMRHDTDERRTNMASDYAGQIVAMLNYEPSYYADLSIESAAKRLGMATIGTGNPATDSSAAKGESLQDTVRIVSGYADLIVLRHAETGAADEAAEASNVPVINAGDGTGENPLQALADAYTVYNERGQLRDLQIVVGGDLAHSREARSFVNVMAKFHHNRFTFVSPIELEMGHDIVGRLHANRVTYSESRDIRDAFKRADVVYWTRRFNAQNDDLWQPSDYRIYDDMLLSCLPDDAIVMHPLPHGDEIDPQLKVDQRVKFYMQAHHRLFTNMALFEYFLR